MYNYAHGNISDSYGIFRFKKIMPSLKIWLFKKIFDPQNAGSSSKFVYKFLYHSHSQLKSQQNASRYLKTKCNQGRIILLP